MSEEFIKVLEWDFMAKRDTDQFKKSLDELEKFSRECHNGNVALTMYRKLCNTYVDEEDSEMYEKALEICEKEMHPGG